MATCTADILTDANYLTDWFTDNAHGTYAVTGGLLAVDAADSDVSGAGAHIYRFVDVPRAQVLAGLTLDVLFGYTAAAALDPGDGLTFNVKFSISGSTSSRRRGTVDQLNATPPYWQYTSHILLTGAATHGPFALVDGNTYTMRQTISATGGAEELLELGYSDSRSAPTIPAGDPLTVKIEFQVDVSPSDLDNPAIHAWMGTPILRGEVSGDPIEITGLQHCTSEPCGCLPFDGVGTPTANQPIHDELIGIGDGSTTVFATNYPYNPQTIEVDVDGEGEDFHPTDWRTGVVTMVTPPASGLSVTATYLRSRYA